MQGNRITVLRTVMDAVLLCTVSPKCENLGSRGGEDLGCGLQGYKPMKSGTLLLHNNAHNKHITSIICVLFPFVTYLLTLLCNW
jgi:hypothetical protein